MLNFAPYFVDSAARLCLQYNNVEEGGEQTNLPGEMAQPKADHTQASQTGIGSQVRFTLIYSSEATL